MAGHGGAGATVCVLSCSLLCFLSSFISRTSQGRLGLGCPGHSGGKWMFPGPPTFISLYLLPYLSLWEHLADNIFQRENIKLKRALGLLSLKLLILLIGSTELCPQSSTRFENEPATSLIPSLINWAIWSVFKIYKIFTFKDQYCVFFLFFF